jgi:hypothetical protein
VLEPFVFASGLHAVTLLFASLTLAGSAGTMLFVREESEILLHRPVHPAELLRAKCSVLIAFSLLLALALNAAGLVTSLWNRGNAWWFPAVHALTTVQLMLFSAAAIVLVYNVCLRWFGRERLDNLLALVQTLLTIAMVAGSQLVPRALGAASLEQVDLTRPWILLIPPVWFGALDTLLCGAAPFERVWLPAAIGVAATALLAWLAFVRLGAAYGIGLMALGESQERLSDGPTRRRLGRVTTLPPLRWWLRDPVERHAFVLASAYLVRDRETKLKVYPSLAPLLVMPIVLGLGMDRRGVEGGEVAGVFALGYVVIVPIQALILLHRSEHWRAADLFRLAPVAHWTPLFHGARKAVVCWLALPALALVAALIALLRGTWSPLLIALPMLVAVLVCSFVPGLVGAWLPLSKPNTDPRDSALGCAVLGGVMAGVMMLGALASWLHGLGWFWPFLAATLFLGFGLQALFVARLRARRWRPVERTTLRRRHDGADL